MADQDTGGATNEGAGGSPQPAQQGELVSTMEFVQKANAEPEGANNTGAQKKADDNASPPGKGEGKPEETAGAKGDDGRLDKHPRFQQLIAERDELKTSLKTLNNKFTQLEAQVTSGNQGRQGTESQEDSPLKKLSEMDKDELADFISDHPHEYTNMILTAAKADLKTEFGDQITQSRYEDAVISELEAFAKDNPDFDPMWESGMLEQFIESHPGHNAISAYYTLTADKRKGEIQDMIDKAVKEAESKFTANQRAKNSIKVIPSAPQGAANPNAIDAELQDTKKHGGAATVLANRLSRFRQAKAGGMV